MGPGSRRNFSGTSRRHRKYSPATQGSRVTENFSEASKILHLPHKVSVCHLRLFPTSKYTVRGQHLGGIEIVAPATQNPWQGSQIVYRVTSDPNVGRVTQLVDVWAGPGSSHLRPYPKVGRVTGIEKIAPATQKGGGVTSDHGPGVTQELLRNFSEASKIFTCHTRK